MQIHSLIRRLDTLLTRNKFPVSAHREFHRNRLITFKELGYQMLFWVPSGKIPSYFPANREFGFRDGFAPDCLLQQTVRLSLDFSFLYRKPGSCRGVRGPARRYGRQRRVGLVNITRIYGPKAAPYRSAPCISFADEHRRRTCMHTKLPARCYGRCLARAESWHEAKSLALDTCRRQPM